MARYSRYASRWAPYVPVAKRRQQAEREASKRSKGGQTLAPVRLTGKQIAGTVWGQAWCDNLESYQDYENRLPRGRTYVRNGSVIDLRIATGQVRALVSGSEIYEIAITITPVPAPRWRAICQACAGGIESIVELLQGRLSKGVMEKICDQQTGLFPKPGEIRFSCSCPDHASLCKHIAAVMYGIGARLDTRPELLFQLRGVDPADLVTDLGKALPAAGKTPRAGRVLGGDDVAAVFGLDMDTDPQPAPVKAKRAAPKPSRTVIAPPKPPRGAIVPGAKKPASVAGKAKPGPDAAKAAMDGIDVLARQLARQAKSAAAPDAKKPSARAKIPTVAGKTKPGGRQAAARPAQTTPPPARGKSKNARPVNR